MRSVMANACCATALRVVPPPLYTTLWLNKGKVASLTPLPEQRLELNSRGASD